MNYKEIDTPALLIDETVLNKNIKCFIFVFSFHRIIIKENNNKHVIYGRYYTLK